ncbi:thiamine phosphate synthase [Paenibacillus sp. LHD-117]|uniref:thiamine phosphate synthase n=1 Tax=Paenibacillus sp. LHD-117 TaxID=3071412 RepID=UPI0027E1B7E4|nr:thiamine phosphate synthase [Paenibacillus sp. LHD-117]MDQ6418326.1 thiamine phosphate synthase [Paenibacillus sp. LHD-117]
MRNRVNWDRVRLYVITAESNHPGRSVIEVMEQTLIGGAGMLQLRNKTGTREQVLEQARALRVLTRRYGVPFIVNDYPDIAMEVGADGVHLGQEDMTVLEARALLGEDKIIGISTHCLEHALRAEEAGADYIGVGPVFPTDTKPGRKAVTTSYVREAASNIRIPFVAIGGITLGNADSVIEAGATRLCAVSAVVSSPDPAATCRAFLRKLDEAEGRRNREAGDRPLKAAALVELTLNGNRYRTSASNLESLLLELGQRDKRLVAELNGEIVPRGSWQETALADGLRIELIQFVGGG